MTNVPLISILLLVPLVGILAIIAFGRDARSVKYIALITSLIPLLIAITLYVTVDFDESALQYVEEYAWIPALGISYKVGVDGISTPMVLLTTLLTFLVCIYSWDLEHRIRAYFSFFLLLDISLIGTFVAIDLFLFYVFWEVVLVPMYLIINIWGGPRKEYAAIKFFLYTFLGSLVMLLGIIALYFNAGVGSFDLTEIAAASDGFSRTFQILTFAALFVGFAVKMPVVPVHTWLPDAHVEAPTGGSVLLAGVLLKMGSYGLIRIAVPLLPDGAEWFGPIMLAIGILSIIYGALICLAQQDLKRLVAYSSVSHMGIVLLGIAGLIELGISGAVYMMFAHGFISALLFMIVGSIHHSVGTREIPALGGLATTMPKAGFIITAGALASLGLPGMVQFVAEFMVFLATYQVFGLLFILPVLTVVITAGYYLWVLKRAIFGPVATVAVEAHDLHGHEFWPMMILILMILFFGLAPTVVLDFINTSVNAVLGTML
ncbi:MAG: NuoM family protein [Candidatus Bipolaricaulia bacterium]